MRFTWAIPEAWLQALIGLSGLRAAQDSGLADA
jgi:hypothetical protein